MSNQYSYTSEKPCLFLPHYGEFGWLIMHHIRVVNKFKTPYKIVCCQPEHRIYFPSANEFIDWKNPIPDRARRGTKFSDINDKNKLIQLFKKTRSECEIIETCVYTHDLFTEVFKLKPIEQIKEIPQIAICVRNRRRRAEQNYTKWDNIVYYLASKNYKMACVGTKESTKAFDQIKVNSWDYFDNESACVEILSKCKLYLGNNSGLSHLAAFCQAPMLTFDDVWRGQSFVYSMQATNKNHFEWVAGNDVNDVIKLIEPLLVGV